jgi:outer membrane protein
MNMKSRVFMGMVMALLILGVVQPSLAKELKFGVVNIQDVLDSIEEGKKAKSEMEKTILNRKRELESKQKEYKKMEDEYEKQKLILSPDALEKKRKALEDKKAELQKYYLTAQQEMQKKELQLTGDILKRIKAVVEKIGKEGKYSFIWEKNEGGLVYYQGAHDVTKEVIKQYNKAYK